MHQQAEIEFEIITIPSIKMRKINIVNERLAE